MAESKICYDIEVLSEHVSTLGEAPFWNEKLNTLIYVDCFRKELCLLDLNSKLSERRSIAVDALSAGMDFITAAIPYASSNGGSDKFLILAMNRLYRFDFDTNEVCLVHQTQAGTKYVFNDGKCDTRGRLWVGVEKCDNLNDLHQQNDEGNVQCINGDYQTKICDEKYRLPNGLAWSPDYKHLFWADFLKRIIWAYDFDEESMSLKNNRVLFDFTTIADYNENGGYPDGLTTDLHGHLYVACWEGGRIAKLCTTTGKPLDTIKMPVPNVTSLCFGGNDYTQLFVTTASVGVDQKPVGIPDSGKIFRITCNDEEFKGFAQNYFVEGT